MVYINRAWIARIKEDGSSPNIRFPNAMFLFISNINPSLTFSLLFKGDCTSRVIRTD
jgi:hypothetical protein